jgi:hypothetical protein
MFHAVSEIQIVDTLQHPETLTSAGFAVGLCKFNRTLLGSNSESFGSKLHATNIKDSDTL